MRIVALRTTPITLPVYLSNRLGTDTPPSLSCVGNPGLLEEHLLGLIASRECLGQVLIETLDQVPKWVNTGKIIVSGFHSPLEQQVLRSLLRRRGRVVKVLARGMSEYRPQPEEREPLATSRMLVVRFSKDFTKYIRVVMLPCGI